MHVYSVWRPRIAVVVGSNRPRRICPEIAACVQHGLHAAGLVAAELVDLQEIDLPFLDEPILPAQGRYEHAHTVRWSELVHSYNGFVFVFPQYNWGYPAVLKNGLDFLYHEWINKARSACELRQPRRWTCSDATRTSLQGLHMRSTATNIELKTDGAIVTDDGNVHDPDAAFADYLPQVIALAVELNHLATGMAKTSHRDPRPRNQAPKEIT
jgi:NAD(P)H-dependent FMN reductase